MIKLGKAPKGRWDSGSKITSIRIPLKVAQVVEGLGIRAGTHSATDTIIQILEGFISGKKMPKGVKLVWAKKGDASSRKQYGKAKPVKKVKAKKVSKPKAKKAVAHKAKPKTRKPVKAKAKTHKAHKPVTPEAAPAAPSTNGQSEPATAAGA